MRSDRSFTPLAAVAAALVLAVGLAFAALPKQDFSERERRYLAQPPVFSWQGGVFSNAFEGYVQDHLPLRDSLLELDANRRLYVGLNLMDDIWLTADQSLVEAAIQPNEVRILANVERLRAFCEHEGLTFRLLIVPSAGAVQGEGLPLAYPDAGLIARIGEALADGTLINVLPAFATAKEPLYYRTDPHWNARGAYLAYAQAAASLGFEPLSAESFIKGESPGFYGSSYGRSGFFSLPPDKLQYWSADLPLQLSFSDKPGSFDSLFFQEHLEGGDQYPFFLDGNHGLSRMERLSPTSGQRLLVCKDSFGNSLIPLLLPHYAGITAVDLRSHREPLSELVEAEKPDCLLAVYSLNSLNQEGTFAWLR